MIIYDFELAATPSLWFAEYLSIGEVNSDVEIRLLHNIYMYAHRKSYSSWYANALHIL